MPLYGYICYDIELSYTNPAQVCLIVSSNGYSFPYYILNTESEGIFKRCSSHAINNETPSSHITTMLQQFSMVNAPLTPHVASFDRDDIAAYFVSNEKISCYTISSVINAIAHTSFDCETNLSGYSTFPESYEDAFAMI